MQRTPNYQQKISQKFEAERWQIVDECSFSIVVIKFWHILAARRWTCALSERFFLRKAFLFGQTCPKVKFAVSRYLATQQKSWHLFSM